MTATEESNDPINLISDGSKASQSTCQCGHGDVIPRRLCRPLNGSACYGTAGVETKKHVVDRSAVNSFTWPL